MKKFLGFILCGFVVTVGFLNITKAEYLLTESDYMIIESFNNKIDEVAQEKGDAFKIGISDLIRSLAIHKKATQRVATIFTKLADNIDADLGRTTPVGPTPEVFPTQLLFHISDENGSPISRLSIQELGRYDMPSRIGTSDQNGDFYLDTRQKFESGHKIFVENTIITLSPEQLNNGIINITVDGVESRHPYNERIEVVDGLLENSLNIVTKPNAKIRFSANNYDFFVMDAFGKNNEGGSYDISEEFSGTQEKNILEYNFDNRTESIQVVFNLKNPEASSNDDKYFNSVYSKLFHYIPIDEITEKTYRIDVATEIGVKIYADGEYITTVDEETETIIFPRGRTYAIILEKNNVIIYNELINEETTTISSK